MLKFVVFCMQKFIAFANEFEQTEKRKESLNDRASLLDPNADSVMKIERYTFTLNQELILGEPKEFEIPETSPDTTIRIQRRFSNAPCPGFVITKEMRLSNLYVNVNGPSEEDEYIYANEGIQVDFPTMSPVNRFSVKGRYTGHIPRGFVKGNPFLFCMTFVGPSTIC